MSFPIKFGEAGQYELSEDALNHILWGDLVVRPRNASVGGVNETVLAGGLHTYVGWERFVSLHPNVVHLLQYEVNRHDDWFFARELQNGVITLKIPRRLFTGNAASITRQPDLYYKSGYLWKTLFPMSYTVDAIVKAIGEAIENIDREDSTFPTAENPAGVIYGYTAIHEPLAAMKLRIQLNGSQIRSAFPAWEQPFTGNNGKPYSHEHSISFQIAESTVKAGDFQKVYGPVFPDQKFDLQALVELTPDFILTRMRRDPSAGVDAWQAAREENLQRVAEAASKDDLAKIEVYLRDYVCSKDPFSVQCGLYQHYLAEINHSLAVFNVGQLIENIGECIRVLTMCDSRFQTRVAIDAMVRFLGMAVVHTGGLNTLLYKRLLGQFLTMAIAHHDKEALKDVIAALATSPCRGALYTEFDLNPFVKQNDYIGLSVIGLSGVKLEMKPEHLFEFIAFNLGENYLILFAKEQRLALAREMFASLELQRMVADSMSFLKGSDFDFFMPVKLELSQLGTKVPPAEDYLIAIAKDYGRMLILQRQRVVLEDPAAHKEEPDFDEWGTQKFFELIRQKHKRMFIQQLHEMMLKDIIQFADQVGYGRLKANCERALAGLPTESIPLPKRIPDYINSWHVNHKKTSVDVTTMVEQILGREST